jgi:hypothetical protein
MNCEELKHYLEWEGIDCSHYPVTKARMTEYICYLCEKKDEGEK